jgi:hypothetical protein
VTSRSDIDSSFRSDRGLGLPAGRTAQRVGGDERVAVAIAADPGTGQQHRPGQQPRLRPALVQGPAQLRVDGGDDVEERELVVAQRLVDLVLQPQPGQPEEGRLPEGQHRAPQLRRPLVLVELTLRRPVALPEQVGDLALHLEDRPAPHLGGVRGHHGAHQRAGELPGHHVGGELGLVEQREGGGQAALLRRRSLAPVVAPAPLVVDVLGQVRQHGEVAEGPDDVVGHPDVQARQPIGQLLAGDLGTTDPEGIHPGRLHQAEDVVASLLADDLAEHPAEDPDVLAEGLVAGRTVGRAGTGWIDGVTEVGYVDSGFGHSASIRVRCDGDATAPSGGSP